MAGIASGISTLALGGRGDARRRPTQQPQSTPDSNSSSYNSVTKTDTNTYPTPYEEFAYVNSGKQNIKGLTNQTGHVKGNANGVINFGTLTASAGALRHA